MEAAMPFCPSRRAEYHTGTEVCAECQTQLVRSLEVEQDTADMVDIYLCYDPQMADRAQALLEENGFEVLVRDSSSTAFPVTVGEAAALHVAVAASHSTEGKKLLADATADGVLTGDGRLL
jgi:hypothetical protein